MLAYRNSPIRAVICQFQWSCFLVFITITCLGQQLPTAMRTGTSEGLYTWCIVMYGVEIWTLRTVDHKCLESFEVCCIMMEISCTDHAKHEELRYRGFNTVDGDIATCAVIARRKDAKYLLSCQLTSPNNKEEYRKVSTGRKWSLVV
jgi:hypothetical protein